MGKGPDLEKSRMFLKGRVLRRGFQGWWSAESLRFKDRIPVSTRDDGNVIIPLDQLKYREEFQGTYSVWVKSATRII